MDLQPLFHQLALQYSSDETIIIRFWKEIEEAYKDPRRQYHNLTHLENLSVELAACKHLIKDWNTVLFAMFYHDVVYNTLKQNNEEKSALMAESRLRSLKVTEDQIQKCKTLILATKIHEEQTDGDINYFTDADLSILGKDWEAYSFYIDQIRKEYAIYIDLLYNPGRKKVLNHFLSMPRIFKTDFFYEKYELEARKNIASELSFYKTSS